VFLVFICMGVRLSRCDRAGTCDQGTGEAPHGGNVMLSRLGDKTEGLLRAGKAKKEPLRRVGRCLLDLHGATRDCQWASLEGEVICRVPCRSGNGQCQEEAVARPET
jgi:hypothetical protein